MKEPMEYRGWLHWGSGRWGALVALVAVLAVLGWFARGAAAQEKDAMGTPVSGVMAHQAEEDEEPELDEEEQTTLERLRAFWKPEKAPPAEQPALPHVGVPARTEELEYYPCMDCHEDQELNVGKVRALTEEHTDIVLDHGGGRFWCTTCHNLENMNYFRSMKNERIDFNKPFLLCGQCHAPRQKDWFFGGHGKRIGSWRGEKVGLSCTECHYSHSPRIKPRPPDPPPKHHEAADSFMANVMKLGIWKTLGFTAESKGGE